MVEDETKASLKILIVDLGLRIMAARRQANLSREALAKRLTMSKSAIAMWERGERWPTIPHLYEMSILLGVRIHELLPTNVVKSGPERLLDMLQTLPKESRRLMRNLIDSERKAAVAQTYETINEKYQRHDDGTISFTHRAAPVSNKQPQKSATRRKLKSVP